METLLTILVVLSSNEVLILIFKLIHSEYEVITIFLGLFKIANIILLLTPRSILTNTQLLEFVIQFGKLL